MAAPAPASCPKCGAPRGAGPACPRCGLAGDRMAAFAGAGAGDGAVPPEIEAAWERVLCAWDDTGRHDTLLQLVAQHDAYAWTAARYRDAKRAGSGAASASPSPFRSYPDHAVDAVADRQLERLRRAAEATLHASASARDRARDRARPPYHVSKAVLAMLVFAIVAGLIFALVLRAHPPGGTGPAPGEARPAKPAQPARFKPSTSEVR